MKTTTAKGSAFWGIELVGLCLQLDTNIGLVDIGDGDDIHG